MQNRNLFPLPCLMSLLLPLLLWNSPAQAGRFDLRLEVENIFDEQGNRITALEPTIRYKSDTWVSQLEFEKPIHPETRDGTIEWQHDHIWNFDNNLEFTLRNELKHNLDRKRTRSELTPRLFHRKSKALRYGFELEIDYYDNEAKSKFDLFQAELEPTIYWTKRFKKSSLRTELEAPILRLYSKNPDVKNFKYVGYELIFTFNRFLNKNSELQFNLRLPYNAETGEFLYRPNFSYRHKF